MGVTVFDKELSSGAATNQAVIDMPEIGSCLKLMFAWLRVIIKLFSESATSGTKTGKLTVMSTHNVSFAIDLVLRRLKGERGWDYPRVPNFRQIVLW